MTRKHWPLVPIIGPDILTDTYGEKVLSVRWGGGVGGISGSTQIPGVSPWPLLREADTEVGLFGIHRLSLDFHENAAKNGRTASIGTNT